MADLDGSITEMNSSASTVWTNHVIMCVCIAKHACYTVWRKVSLDKNFTQPSPATLAFAEIFSGISFRPCSKGRHRLHVITNTGQKIAG